MNGKNLTKLNKKQIGDEGEDIAAAYLAATGYIILERNWRSGKQEVDIIAELPEAIVFVEVKSRSTAAFGKPQEAVSEQKQKHLIEAANAYAEAQNIEKDIRFDVIAVLMDESNPQIEHITEAFTPEW